MKPAAIAESPFPPGLGSGTARPLLGIIAKALAFSRVCIRLEVLQFRSQLYSRSLCFCDHSHIASDFLNAILPSRPALMKLTTKLTLYVFVFLGSLLLAAFVSLPARAQSAPPHPAAMPVGKPVRIKPPLGLPPVPIPPDNPPTEDSIALGRRLYYDPQLSVDGTISCASCHAPQFAFSDNRPFSHGVGGKLGTRHSPTVINSAYNSLQFWDGRAPSLEEQAKGPIVNPVEMAHSLEGVVRRLQSDPKYPELFKRAWGTDQITIDMVVKSIASFERTILAGDSPFDRFYYGHDSKALPSAAQRGLIIFISAKKGNCAICHPFSPFWTQRPSDNHVLKPATRVAVGRWQAISMVFPKLYL